MTYDDDNENFKCGDADNLGDDNDGGDNFRSDDYHDDIEGHTWWSSW